MAALSSVRVRGWAKWIGAVRTNSARHEGHHEDRAMTYGKGANWSRRSAEGFDPVWRCGSQIQVVVSLPGHCQSSDLGRWEGSTQHVQGLKEIVRAPDQLVLG